MFQWKYFPIGEEFDRFLQSTFPQWNERLITPGFSFDDKKLHCIRGFPGTHGTLVGNGNLPPEDLEIKKEWVQLKEWNKEGVAQESEFKVFQILSSRFANEPSLLVSGFYERNICRLAQDTFNYSEGHDGMTEEVIFALIIIITRIKAA